MRDERRGVGATGGLEVLDDVDVDVGMVLLRGRVVDWFCCLGAGGIRSCHGTRPILL